jgi:hypothetical protein
MVVSAAGSASSVPLLVSQAVSRIIRIETRKCRAINFIVGSLKSDLLWKTASSFGCVEL